MCSASCTRLGVRAQLLFTSLTVLIAVDPRPAYTADSCNGRRLSSFKALGVCNRKEDFWGTTRHQTLFPLWAECQNCTAISSAARRYVSSSSTLTLFEPYISSHVSFLTVLLTIPIQSSYFCCFCGEEY